MVESTVFWVKSPIFSFFRVIGRGKRGIASGTAKRPGDRMETGAFGFVFSVFRLLRIGFAGFDVLGQNGERGRLLRTTKDPHGVRRHPQGEVPAVRNVLLCPNVARGRGSRKVCRDPLHRFTEIEERVCVSAVLQFLFQHVDDPFPLLCPEDRFCGVETVIRRRTRA